MNWEKFSKTKTNIVAVLAASTLCLGFSNSPTVWNKAWGQSGGTQSRKIISDPQSEGSFWLVTSRALFHVDSNRNQSLVLHKSVNAIYQNPNYPDVVYIAAEDGVYMRTRNQLQRILLKHGCLSIAAVSEKIFAGTKNGLMIRELTNGSWRVASGKLAQEAISHLASYGNVVYVVTPSALYRYDTGTGEYREIFSTGVSQEAELEEEDSEDDASKAKPVIIDVDISEKGAIYASTFKGIYYSNNEGGAWEKLPDNGLPLRALNALSLSQNDLWAATAEGAYQFTGEKWQKYDNGLDTNIVYDLIHDQKGNIYAATNRGFFYLDAGKALAGKDVLDDGSVLPSMFKEYRDIEQYFDNEPTVRQVQEMAVNYADVHPDKIKRWHRQSRMKAFVPSLSTGLDRSATDLMHWDTGPNPDVLSKGRDLIEWDVSLSWDLGDMVWSSDQTSIDSRSKLMVELREEVLDQVTRVYFERRRLQVALLARAETGDMAFDEYMRLAELTAIIDGFTGGEFSRRSITKDRS